MVQPLAAPVGIGGVLCYGLFTNKHGSLIHGLARCAWAQSFRDSSVFDDRVGFPAPGRSCRGKAAFLGKTLNDQVEEA
jgi:hypothetical protein